MEVEHPWVQSLILPSKEGKDLQPVQLFTGPVSFGFLKLTMSLY